MKRAHVGEMFREPIFPILTKAFFQYGSWSPHFIVFPAFGARDTEVAHESSIRGRGRAFNGANGHEDRCRLHFVSASMDGTRSTGGGGSPMGRNMDLLKRTQLIKAGG